MNVRILTNLTSITTFTCVTVILICEATCCAWAANSIDVRSELDKALQGLGTVHKTRTVIKTIRGGGRCSFRGAGTHGEGGEKTKVCDDLQVPEVQHYEDALHVQSISTVGAPSLEYGKPQINTIPEKIHLQTFKTRNCSSVQQTATANLSLAVNTNQSITVTRGVVTGVSISAGVSYSIQSVGSANTSVSVNRQWSLTEGSTQSESQTVTRSETVNKAVAPLTELWGEWQVVESNLSVPFYARILVDGNVDANTNGYSRISQVLDGSHRTFMIEGVLNASAASEAHTKYYEKRLNKESDCGTNNQVQTIAFDGPGYLLPLVLNKERVIANSIGQTASFGSPNELGDLRIFQTQVNVTQVRKAAMIAAAPAKMPKAATTSFMAETPSFTAAGQHQCQSKTDIGHTCQVTGIGYDDCNSAYFVLKSDDCCHSTEVCGPDAETGTVKCQLGGTSIGFTMNYCIPQ